MLLISSVNIRFCGYKYNLPICALFLLNDNYDFALKHENTNKISHGEEKIK